MNEPLLPCCPFCGINPDRKGNLVQHPPSRICGVSNIYFELEEWYRRTPPPPSVKWPEEDKEDISKYASNKEYHLGFKNGWNGYLKEAMELNYPTIDNSKTSKKPNMSTIDGCFFCFDCHAWCSSDHNHEPCKELNAPKASTQWPERIDCSMPLTGNNKEYQDGYARGANSMHDKFMAVINAPKGEPQFKFGGYCPVCLNTPCACNKDEPSEKKESAFIDTFHTKLELAKFFKDGGPYDVDFEGLIEYILSKKEGKDG